MPVVEIRNLVKSYRRGGQVVPVLTNITFDIAAGDYVALRGPSGSGKSTLLNLIAGIDKPDSGTLRVGGIDITALSEAELAAWRSRNVGFIFQFYNHHHGDPRSSLGGTSAHGAASRQGGAQD